MRRRGALIQSAVASAVSSRRAFSQRSTRNPSTLVSLSKCIEGRERESDVRRRSMQEGDSQNVDSCDIMWTTIC